MNAEIIAVGTELLLGDIVNTNAQFLAKELANLGINVYFQSVVGDNPQRLKQTLEIAFSHSELVITTGGLGPTMDDLTKETAAAYFDKKLVEDAGWRERLEEMFASRGRVMTPNNLKQALIPEGSTCLYNNNGTAPGILIQEGEKMMVLLPGPPREMKPMFLEQVKPVLEKKQNFTLVSRTLRIAGIGESQLETMLMDVMKAQDNPTIALYADPLETMIRITAKAHTHEEAEAMLDPVEAQINQIVGGAIYGYGRETTMDQVTGQLLLEKGLSLAAAESCTGGLLTAALVGTPGISAVLKEGVVTYSNESKMQRLGVQASTLEQFGAVSAQTAAEMAAGVARTAGTEIGVSTTGVAGPGGGTPEKPVGLVYIGLSFRGEVTTKEVRVMGNRDRIRNLAVYHALDMVRRALLEKA